MNKKPKERSVSPEMKDSNLQTDLSNSPEKNHQQTNISSWTPSSTPITVINTVDKPTLGVLDESAESKVLENKPSETNLSTGASADVNTRKGNAFTDSLKSPYRPSSGYHSDSHKEDSSIDSPNIDMRKSCNNNHKSSSFEETSAGLQFERCFQNSSQSPSDASSCDSSPVVSSSSTRLRRRLLTHRMSVDNQVGSSSRKSLRHSSPESSYNTSDAPFQKRSSSHDTMIPRKGSLSSKAAVESPKAKGKGLIASMESLAVNSLLAAQVLNLIPTAKARERNFLHGRIAANSLLGSVELERTLPNRELRIFVGTWNMNGQAPPKELNDFMLPEGLEHVPDLLAVGTQESYSERFEWEVSIQETIGPSHLLFHSAVLGTLHLAIFLRRDLIWFCSIPEEASISTRPGVAFRTKGAVAIGFVLFGTSYLFITTHLTAHMDKAKERVQDIKRIIRSLELPKLLPKKHKSKDVTANYDCVFWFGDLNFRLDQERGEVVDWVAKQEFPMSCAHNLRNDQLTNIISDGSIFREFQEGPIKFPPSYKYDPGTDNFDTSHKQRTPAYTDRILYKCRGRRESTTASGGNLDCLMYDSVGSICTSDHKPVWGVYKSIVRPGIDTIPLAAGSFNREVFLEGIKRRSAAMSKMHDASTVCQIQ